jgi:hypothetical protein
MKLTIFLIIALFAIAHAEPNCSSDGYCMGCDNAVADKCTDCYNGVVSTIEPRYLSNNNCASKINKMADCTIYDHTLTSADIATTGTALVPRPGCWACGNSKVLTATVGGTFGTANAYQGNDAITALACEADVADAALANCTSRLYLLKQASDTANSHPLCLITAAGKCFKDDVDTAPTAASCTASFANCSNTIVNYTNAAADATAECHDPVAEYAVKSDKASAVSFTTDANCRRLQTDNTNCALCKDGAWFHGAKCYMKGGLIFLSAVAFFVAWFF